jgi:hypothetical protein
MIVGTTPKSIAPPATPEQAREEQISESRKALVKSLTSTVRAAREFWDPIYERMREDQAFACGDQWHDAEDKMSDKYQVNWVQRVLNQQVGQIYAKNPTFTCERRRRLEYSVWDGSEASLQNAKRQISNAAQQDLAATQTGQQPSGPPQEASAIVVDYQHGAQKKRMLDRIAETAELLIEYEIDQQSPDFETQMESLLLREKTTSAGFVTIKFQSEHESVPAASATQASIVDRLNQIHALARALADDPGANDDSAQHEQLKLLLVGLQASLSQGEGKVSQQGFVLDFHPSTSIIIDPKTRCLTEFVAADWISEQLLLTPEQIEAQWQKDVRKTAVRYGHGKELGDTVNLRTKAGGEQQEHTVSPGPWPEKARACVWIIQHKHDQMRYVICHGYEDFLEEPAPPWPPVKGFWHTVAIKLAKVEVEENKPTLGVTCYGQSVARLLRPMQEETNRSQEALREHRMANRPGHVCGKDTLSERDRTNLASRAAHAVIPLDNVQPGGDCSKIVFPIPVVPLQPALYETQTVMQHAMLVSGQQQANIGEQQRNEKATGQAIAEQARVQGASYEAHAQDKFLSSVGRIMGEMALLAMSPQVVQRKVGPGAVWPDAVANREEIRENLFLRVDAGSTGRPNRALEVDNLQALMPQLLELARGMGLPLDPLVKYASRVMDFDFDIEEWLGQAQPAQGPQGRGAAESISIKLADLNPEERAQALAMAGIKASGGPPQPAPAQTTKPGQAGGNGGQGMPAAIPRQAMRMLPK